MDFIYGALYYIFAFVVIWVLIIINFNIYLKILSSTEYNKANFVKKNNLGIKKGFFDICYLTKQNPVYDSSSYKLGDIFLDYEKFLQRNSYGYAYNVAMNYGESSYMETQDGSNIAIADMIIFMKHCVFVIDTLNFDGQLYFNPNEKCFETKMNDGSYFALKQQVANPFMVNDKLSKNFYVTYKNKGKKELCDIIHILLLGENIKYEDSKLEEYSEYYNTDKNKCIVVRSVADMMMQLEKMNDSYKNNGYDLEYDTIINFYKRIGLKDRSTMKNNLKDMFEANTINKERFMRDKMKQQITFMNKCHKREENI